MMFWVTSHTLVTLGCRILRLEAEAQVKDQDTAKLRVTCNKCFEERHESQVRLQDTC